MKLSKSKFILCMVAAFMVGALLMGGIVAFREGQSKAVTNNSKFRELNEFVSQYYLRDYDEDELIEEAYKGYIDGLKDPYSVYMTADEYDSWETSAKGEYGGVGITFAEDEKGNFAVVGISKNSPAEKAGIKPGDVLLKVDGKKYSDIDLMATKIRGDKGTKVEITYSRDGKQKNVTLTRDIINQESVDYKMLDDSTGYIQISSFIESTGDDFAKALKVVEKKGAQNLILDLRDNGGGVVDTCIEVADEFLDEGVVCYVEDKNSDTDTYDAKDGKTSLNTVVLVNENSASASEILAGALKDNGFEIVGTKTFGKGVIQGTFNLEDGSAVKLTIMQYLSPDKHVIQKKGIKPTVTVKDNDKTEADEQLERALEELK